MRACRRLALTAATGRCLRCRIQSLFPPLSSDSSGRSFSPFGFFSPTPLASVDGGAVGGSGEPAEDGGLQSAVSRASNWARARLGAVAAVALGRRALGTRCTGPRNLGGFWVPDRWFFAAVFVPLVRFPPPVSPFLFLAMALSAEDIARGLKSLASDLKFLLTDRGIDEDLQGKIGATGLTTMSLFALSGDDRKDVRSMYKEVPFKIDPDLEGLDSAAKVKARVIQAKLIDVWEAAKVRTEEKARTEAEQRASRMPITRPGGDLVALRRGFEDKYGRREDRDFPADSVIERRLQEVEQGDMKAESLQDIVNREEQSEDPIGAVFDKDGALRIKKGLQRVALPSDSEALRRRVKLLGISYTVARAKHPTRAWLATALPDVWSDHLDYVLGEQVYGFRVPCAGRELRPDWAVVIAYELQIRKEALRQVLYEGSDFQVAMAAARKSTELREKHFVTPTIASMVAGAWDQPPPAPYGPSRPASGSDRPSPFERGRSKGRGKGRKGKGKARVGDGPWHTVTSDGRPICFAFNSASEKCKGSCGRVHCCQICLDESHPAHAHKKEKGEDKVVG